MERQSQSIPGIREISFKVETLISVHPGHTKNDLTQQHIFQCLSMKKVAHQARFAYSTAALTCAHMYCPMPGLDAALMYMMGGLV